MGDVLRSSLDTVEECGLWDDFDGGMPVPSNVRNMRDYDCTKGCNVSCW